MQRITKDLILRTVTKEDISEIARMWEYPDIISVEEAYRALEYMDNTHSKNRPESICHLCLAVFEKKQPEKIIGWCGLDGEAEPDKTVLFFIIDEAYRKKGYATQCAVELLKYAFDDMNYSIIYGGCAKENIASYKVMQKSGMKHTDFYENGDYIFSAASDEFLPR